MCILAIFYFFLILIFSCHFQKVKQELSPKHFSKLLWWLFSYDRYMNCHNEGRYGHNPDKI